MSGCGFTGLTSTTINDVQLINRGCCPRTEEFDTDAAAATAFVCGDVVEIDATTGVASHAGATPAAGKRIAVVVFDFDPRASAGDSQQLRASFYTNASVNAKALKFAGVAATIAQIDAYKVPASIQGIEIIGEGV